VAKKKGGGKREICPKAGGRKGDGAMRHRERKKRGALYKGKGEEFVK